MTEEKKLRKILKKVHDGRLRKAMKRKVIKCLNIFSGFLTDSDTEEGGGNSSGAHSGTARASQTRYPVLTGYGASQTRYPVLTGYGAPEILHDTG